MDPRSQTVRESFEDALGIARRSLRHVKWAVLIAVVGTAAGVAMALHRPRSYQSETVILYRDVVPARLLDDDGGEDNYAGRFREMLLSRPLLARVAQRHGLYPEEVARAGEAAAVEKLREQIEFSERGTRVFSIGFTGTTPAQAQAVTAQLAHELVAWHNALQLEAVTVTTQFLGEQRRTAQERVETAEHDLAAFLARHPSFAFELNTTGTGVKAGASVRARPKTQAAARAAPDRLEEDVERRLRKQRDEAASRLEATTGATASLRSPELESSAQRVQEAAEVLAERRAAYTEQHPDVIDAKARLARAQSELARARETGRLRAARAGEARSARRANAADELARLERELSERESARRRRPANAQRSHSTRDSPAGANTVNVELETEWARLLRDVEDSRERLRAVDSTSLSAEIGAASEVATQGTQLTVLDPASMPVRPSGAPRRMLVMVVAILSLGLGFAVSVALGVADDRILSHRDLRALDAGPVLGIIPRMRYDD